MKNVLIEKLDNFGYGIAHIDGKVVFIFNAIPGEIVNIQIVKENKRYCEGKVIEYLKLSSKRVESKCPYFQSCGGCHLFFYSYQNSLNFKLNKIKELFLKNKISYSKPIEIVSNEHPNFYRNKVSLKIQDGLIGYYKEQSHQLVPISTCMVGNDAINQVIAHYQYLNIDNGLLTIRSNYNGEVLLIIESLQPNYSISLQELKKHLKIVGIIYNDKLIYGQSFFYERIEGMLFKVSYNSFFQVNPYITSKLFQLVLEHIDTGSKVLDLYSGVGTLSIVASKKAKEVLSVEIIPNAVLNGIKNAKLNQQNNIKFLLGDVEKTVSKLNQDFDIIILDPPRKGLDKKTIQFIRDKKIKKVIYISCNLSTFIRDTKLLEDDYTISTYFALDMFSYTYHLESFAVFIRK